MATLSLGVDLGQVSDPTAIVLAEPSVRPGPFGQPECHFAVRLLERLPLGTDYPDVAARIAEIVTNLRARHAAEQTRQAELARVADLGTGWGTGDGHTLQPMPMPAIRLTVDNTGVGRPVVDILRRRLSGNGGSGSQVALIPATFTHGDRLIQDETTRAWRVGKAYLVSRLQALMQTGRIRVPRTAETDALLRELRDYEIKVDADANDRYGAFRVGSHDDLVTALGLACLVDLGVASAPTYRRHAASTGVSPYQTHRWDGPAALRRAGRPARIF